MLKKRLFLVFLALWLPLSVLAANGMAMQMGAPASLAAGEHTGTCPEHEGGDAEPAYGECHGCSFCQFACTAMMTFAGQAVDLGTGWIEALAPMRAGARYIPDRLQRPPLAS